MRLIALLCLTIAALLELSTAAAGLESRGTCTAREMNRLGLRYRDGKDGAKPDATVARKWFLKAAAAGDLAAEINAANMLKEGVGGLKDPVGGYALLLEAQDQFEHGGQFDELSVGRFKDDVKIVTKTMTPEQVQAAKIKAAHFKPVQPKGPCR